MKTKTILIVVFLLALIALTGVTLTSAQSSRSGANSPAGAWIVTVTFDPQFGAPPMVAPVALTRDNLVINSNNAGLLSIGVWEPVKQKQFLVTFVGYEPSDGETIHYQVKATVELSQDGAQFSGVFTNEVFNANNDLLFTLNGTIQGERIQIEPME